MVNARTKEAIVTGALRGISHAVTLQAGVHSAGIMKILPLRTSTIEDSYATFATNVGGTFNVLEQAARRLSDRQRIATLASVTRTRSGIRAVQGGDERRRSDDGWVNAQAASPMAGTPE